MSAIVSTVNSRFRRPLKSPYLALPAILITFFTLGGGFIAAMFNMQYEITEGPNRPLRQVASAEDSWVLQRGSNNLVDDSLVPRSLVPKLQAKGFAAVGFNRSYRPVQVRGVTKQVMILDTPPAVSSGKAGVVVDKTIGAKNGETILIVGQRFVVTGQTSGSSSLGKEGVFLSTEQFNRLGGDPNMVFGVFVKKGLPRGEFARDYAVIPAKQFEHQNQEYWFNNGGSLTLLVAGNVQIYSVAVVLCVLALGFALTRKQAIDLRLAGATCSQIARIEGRYLLVVWALSLPLQAVMYHLLVRMFASTSLGYLGRFALGELVMGWLAMLVVVVIYYCLLSLYVRRVLKSERLATQL